jgi:hypothetical protein
MMQATKNLHTARFENNKLTGSLMRNATSIGLEHPTSVFSAWLAHTHTQKRRNKSKVLDNKIIVASSVH